MRSRAIIASPALWGLVCGAALGLVLAACASSKSPMVATAELDLRKKEIQDLWIQIRDWRVDHQWSAEPAAGMRVPGLLKDIRRCKAPREPSTDVCQDICTLKDAVCDNAQSICRIAGELGGDAWADEKCKSAKASCKEATEKCCECTASEASSVAPPGRDGT
ncbi:MAG TPA: hypothetical protein VK698_31925 [Kofleriaceae bacterium]|nr:hypothetical protein [Kofleriaceae bacterium]